MTSDFYTLTISEVTELTRESIAISFNVPDQLIKVFQFIQGQYLTLSMMIEGEEVRRCYSICCDVNKQTLQVGIKRVLDGVFSNYAMENFKVGMPIEVMVPQGNFYTELAENNQKHYLCIAAGSGITPILSQISSILSTEKNSSVSLIFSNKSTALMMFREKLSFIKNQYLNRFEWINLFTNEQHEADIFNGRISANKLAALNEKHLIAFDDINDVFVCGPEELLENITPFLESKGLTDNNIHYELFFSDSAEHKSKEKQQQREATFGDEASRVTVTLSGRQTSFSLPFKGQNILDAALYEGADLPFSCKAGVCSTCKAQLIKGEVEMDQNHSLTDEEVADGMILTCQSHPLSGEVDIDFDVV
ncbi:MAG: phenylacetic acid degradation protein [Gammaproteobacteria bacterium]|nr:MAG: phenylacetic acid degradation protein [Gammaproteobacteria bacterium]